MTALLQRMLVAVVIVGLLLAAAPVAAQTTADLAVDVAVVDDLADPQVVRVRITNLGPADSQDPIATVQVDGGPITHHTADPQPGSRADGVGCATDTAATELSCSWDVVAVNSAVVFDVGVEVDRPTTVSVQVDPAGTPDPVPDGNNTAAVDLRPATADLAITDITADDDTADDTASADDQPAADGRVAVTVTVANRQGRTADVELQVVPDRSVGLEGPCAGTGLWTCDVGAVAPGGTAAVELVLQRPEPDGDPVELTFTAVPVGLVDPDPDAATRTVMLAPREAVPGDVVRHAGAERVGTAIAISRARFAAGEARAVVLARADAHADALAGGPLAAATRAPVLLTAPGQLATATAAEIERVLPAGGIVHLLGGHAALSEAVEEAVVRAGYRVQRIAGPNRYATAVAVWEALGRPPQIAAADGDGHADAVVAGAAMAAVQGALLLTAGDRVPAELAPLVGQVDHAVGAPAAAALPEATALAGPGPAATGVAVAEAFFTAPDVVGIATAEAFPDALAGGALTASLKAPLLLTDGTSLSPEVVEYLTGTPTVTTAHLLGGTAALSSDVAREVAAAIAR